MATIYSSPYQLWENLRPSGLATTSEPRVMQATQDRHRWPVANSYHLRVVAERYKVTPLDDGNLGDSMQRPRSSSEPSTPPPAVPSRLLPSWPALGLEDAKLDPDWCPSPLVAFSSPPSWWRRWLQRPVGVVVGMIAVAALALLTTLVYLERPNGGNTGMLPVGIPPYVSTASPTATDITEDDTVKALKTSQRGGDNQQGKAPRVPEPARLDDPILVWLPEILAASRETGVPLALIAGMIRIESQGEPQAASPAGARGLM